MTPTNNSPSRERHWLLLASISAAVALGGNIITTRGNLAVERQRVEGQLLLNAVATPDSAQAAKNIIFLKELGLIRDPNGAIEALRTKSAESLWLRRAFGDPVNWNWDFGDEDQKKAVEQDAERG